MDNIPWGLGITAVGMGTVFALLLLLMLLLMLIGQLDRPARDAVGGAPHGEAPATDPVMPAAAAEPAPAAPSDAAALEAATPETWPPAPRLEILHDGLTADQVTAIAVAVMTHVDVRRKQAAPEARTFAPGSQIHTSRWVAVGRSAQNQSWRRR